MILEIVCIGGLGLVFGSFVNALLWRVRKQHTAKKTKLTIKKHTVDLSMTTGRSVCVHCGHVLAVKDLIPLFSWLQLGGKCRYCKKPIDDSPLVEVGLSLVFVISFLVWPFELSGFGDWVYFGFWQALVVGLWALLIYDVRWMILPNKILYPLYAVALIQRVIEVIVFDKSLTSVASETVLGVLVGGGIFYALFQISQGRWIGGGDVKLGFLIGIILGPLYSAIALISAFYIAAIYILPLMILRKVTRKSKIPFGPFLIIGLFIIVLWGETVIDLYTDLVGM